MNLLAISEAALLCVRAITTAIHLFSKRNGPGRVLHCGVIVNEKLFRAISRKVKLFELVALVLI